MLSRCWRSEAFINMLLETQRLGSCARAGKFGTSAAIGQVLPPKAQMVAQQDWKYVSGGGRVRTANPPCYSLCKLLSNPTLSNFAACVSAVRWQSEWCDVLGAKRCQRHE